MKNSILFTFAALLMSVLPVCSEDLTKDDKEQMLATLQKIKDGSDAKMAARFRVAVSAYQQAIGSSEAAMDLYLKCYEKIHFKDQGKDGAGFKEWKEKSADRLKDPAFKLALRVQLRWLCLTLQASLSHTDRNTIGHTAIEVVDSIFANADQIQGQQGVLRQSVMSCVYAQAYGIGGVEVENWPMAPMNIAEIYNKLIFPPLRKTNATAELQSAWTKRIQQEIILQTKISEKQGAEKQNPFGSRQNSNEDSKSERFMLEELPRLTWQMDKDLFTHGDQANASKRMIAQIQKYASHSDVMNWVEELESLLKPKKKPGEEAGAPIESSPVETTSSPDVPVVPTAPETTHKAEPIKKEGAGKTQTVKPEDLFEPSEKK